MAPGSSSVQSVPSPHNIDAFVKHGRDGEVLSGTLKGLIQELIDAKTGNNYKETFFALYRSFTTGEEVLQLLIEQFETISSSGTMAPSTDVRPFIFLVLELWQDLDYIAPTDAQLLRRIRDFAASVQSSSIGSVLSCRAQLLVKSTENTLALFASATPPFTIPCSTSRPPDRRSPEDFSPGDLADVLTSIEGDRHRKLMAFDFVYWLEGNHKPNAVNSFIVENQKLSCWAEKSILRSHDQSQRTESLKYFLQTIKECIRLHNFSSACALSAGVTTKAIADLKRTYGDLDSTSKNLFRDTQKLISVTRNESKDAFAPWLNIHLKKLISGGKNPMTYRSAIKQSEDACIPWLCYHLKGLKMTHRGFPAPVDEGGRTNLINFERCRCIHRRIREIQSYKPIVMEPSNPLRHARLRSLVNVELAAITSNKEHYSWAQRRGDMLAAEEKASYYTYDKELTVAGFRTPTSHPRRIISMQFTHEHPAPLRPATSQRSAAPQSTHPPNRGDREGAPITTPFTSPTLQSETPSSSTQPAASPRPNNYNRLVDLFNRDSEQCLDGRIRRSGSHPKAGGGYADIWEGQYGDQRVAIKCIRCFSSNGGNIDESKLLRRLWREYAAWTWVSHPIVLKCLGFTFDFSHEPYTLPSLISPWMSNGTLTEYLISHPEKDRLEILLIVADGLGYLHIQNPAIVHGDIRGNNILISDSGLPCLSDFGLSKVLKLEGFSATEPGGSLRWMSPELFRGKGVPSKESDVWAFAMTVLETMSGRVPYAEMHEAAALNMIYEGQLPLRSLHPREPTLVSDDVWAICQKCWNIVPRLRPSMQEVCSELTSLVNGRV